MERLLWQYVNNKPSNRRSKLDVSWIFAQHFLQLRPDLTDGTPYTTNLHVFLRPWVGSMNIIRIKILGPMNLIKIKMPTTCEEPPPPPPPPLLRLVGNARRKSDQIFEFVPQSRP